MGNAERIAATAIARARDAYGSADAFDWMIQIEGIARFGELYDEVYILANESHPRPWPGMGEEELTRRKERANALWEKVYPELEKYRQRVRDAKYRGWSRESGGPVRRVTGVES